MTQPQAAVDEMEMGPGGGAPGSGGSDGWWGGTRFVMADVATGGDEEMEEAA